MEGKIDIDVNKVTVSLESIQEQLREKLDDNGIYEFIDTLLINYYDRDEFVKKLFKRDPSIYIGPLLDSGKRDYSVNDVISFFERGVREYYEESDDSYQAFQTRLKQLILILAVKYLDLDLSTLFKKTD